MFVTSMKGSISIYFREANANGAGILITLGIFLRLRSLDPLRSYLTYFWWPLHPLVFLHPLHDSHPLHPLNWHPLHFLHFSGAECSQFEDRSGVGGGNLHHVTNGVPASRIKQANRIQNPGRYNLCCVGIYCHGSRWDRGKRQPKKKEKKKKERGN